MAIKMMIKRMPGCGDLPIPQYMTAKAAGMDIYAAVSEAVELHPGEIRLIPTGLVVAVPEGYEAQIRPRSGLALKHGLTMVNTPGTIDADYRGEIGLIMINLGQEPFIINRGERVAQMVINKIEQVELVEVAELDQTNRSTGGFGHTGI